jgi:hypothetical protein
VGIRNCETGAALRKIEQLALLSRKGALCPNPSSCVKRATGRMAIINFLWHDFQIVAERKSQASKSAIIDQR